MYKVSMESKVAEESLFASNLASFNREANLHFIRSWWEMSCPPLELGINREIGVSAKSQAKS